MLPKVKIVSQDELMADKLKNYLYRHPEIENTLTHYGSRNFEVSLLNSHAEKVAQKLFSKIELKESKSI